MRTKSKGILLMAFAAGLGFTSCSDESPWRGSSEEGGIELSLNTDGRVMRMTRADDSQSPVVPASDSFAINLTKSDGSYSKDWSSLEGFNREDAFPIGDYTLKASYGDIAQEGFDNPYYVGHTEVHVAPGVTNNVSVTATLGNAMVSVRYTDEFKANFSAWSAATQTEGHDWVMFSQNEDRPAYITPGDVLLNLTLTNANDERVTIQPAGFKAEARHHYVVTVGVTGSTESGNLQLDIVFDEDVIAETVNVNLGDDLFSAPAPTVSANGFTVGTAVETYEYTESASAPRIDVFAFGGFKEVILNVITDDGETPDFGSRVDLMTAEPLTQQQLLKYGIDAAGFFKNPDKMGVIMLKNFLEKVGAGTYSIEVYAVDALTRQSEPVKFEAVVKPTVFAAAASQAVDFQASEVTVEVSANTEGVKNKLKFLAPNANNQMVDAPVKSVSVVTDPAGKRTRADLPYTFRYVLDAAPMPGPSFKVEAHLPTSHADRVSSTEVTMKAPEYTVEADAFSKFVVLKVTGTNDAASEYLRNHLAFYNGSNAIPSANIKHDQATGYITISGLTPNVTYTSLKTSIAGFEQAIAAFTTEAATAAPNGDFSAVSRTINIQNIKTGGEFTGTVFGSPKYQHTANIERDEANGWASLNDLTCYSGSNPQNTWFMVPSTYVEDGKAIVRSVGYSHNGTLPGVDKKTGRWYNPTAASNLTPAAGEMFLGAYSFAAGRTDGIEWNCRPISLSFDYSYSALNNEQAEMYVKLLDSSNAVVAESTLYLNAVSSMTTKTINFGYPFGKKAAKIQLGFKSTKSGVTPTINIPSGSDLNDGAGLSNSSTGTNTYKAVALGSVLTVDNVKFSYDVAGSVNSGKRRR